MSTKIPFSETVAERSVRFDALSLPLSNLLYSSACRMTGNATRADDLVQDTYTCAWSKFETFEPGTNFKAWLFKIMMFCDRNSRRNAKRDPVSVESLDTISQSRVQTESEITPVPGGWTSLYDDITDDVFKRALDRLDAGHREVLMLVSLAELSYLECADALDVPVGTIMSRLHRARKQLQSELAAYARERGWTGSTMRNKREVKNESR